LLATDMILQRNTMYSVEPDPFPESDLIKMILETLYHKAAHDYNKWTGSRNKKETLSFEDANAALVRYGRKNIK